MLVANWEKKCPYLLAGGRPAAVFATLGSDTVAGQVPMTHLLVVPAGQLRFPQAKDLG